MGIMDQVVATLKGEGTPVDRELAPVTAEAVRAEAANPSIVTPPVEAPAAAAPPAEKPKTRTSAPKDAPVSIAGLEDAVKKAVRDTLSEVAGSLTNPILAGLNATSEKLTADVEQKIQAIGEEFFEGWPEALAAVRDEVVLVKGQTAGLGDLKVLTQELPENMKEMIQVFTLFAGELRDLKARVGGGLAPVAVNSVPATTSSPTATRSARIDRFVLANLPHNPEPSNTWAARVAQAAPIPVDKILEVATHYGAYENNMVGAGINTQR
jgi:hypothetical protein